MRQPPLSGKGNGGLLSMFGGERLLHRQFFGRRGRPSIPTVMIDAFNIMQDRITRARLAGDPPDVMVSPRLGHVGWFDFHRAAEAIEIGAEATEKALEGDRRGHRGAVAAGRPGRAAVEVIRNALGRADVIAHRFRLLALHLSTRYLTTSPIETRPTSLPLEHRHMAEFSGRHALHELATLSSSLQV